MALGKQKLILFIGLGVTASITLIYLIIRWTGSSCESHMTVQDFDVVPYLGLWYEFARSDNIPFEEGECVTAEYELNGSRQVKVTNSQYL